MAPRIAKSLDVLRSQINAKYPGRSKLSDGWIGDAAHQATASDHNPNRSNVVTALDITHDPAHGVDTWALAETLRQRRDRRIKYVISNGRIFSSVTSPWTWRPYTGANKHAHHIHVSVSGDPALYDDAAAWALDGAPAGLPAPVVLPPKGITADMRQRMMKAIMAYEGKIPPVVFIAPDGRPEIAGITQKDHPQKYAELKQLLDRGQTDKLQAAVIAYYLEYTAAAQNWTDRAGPEFFLRDCIINRGPTGAAEILQMALGLEVDHQVGPTTRGALAKQPPDRAVDLLRVSREIYEEKKYGKANRIAKGQWDGLVNRWNKAQAQAKAFQKEQGSPPVGGAEAIATTTAVVVGTGAAASAKKTEWTTGEMIGAGLMVLLFALAIFGVVRFIRNRK